MSTARSWTDHSTNHWSLIVLWVTFLWATCRSETSPSTGVSWSNLQMSFWMCLLMPLQAFGTTPSTISARKANTEIYQKGCDSNPNPPRHTACRSLCFLLQTHQMISSLTSISSSTSTCIKTSSTAKNAWNCVKDALCDLIGALMHGFVLWLWTSSRTSLVASRSVSGNCLQS